MYWTEHGGKMFYAVHCSNVVEHLSIICVCKTV